MHFPLCKQPSWHIPFASSLGGAEEEEEEVMPAQLGRARAAPGLLLAGGCPQLECKLGVEGYGKAKLLKIVPLQAQILYNSGLLFVVVCWDVCYS